MIISLFNSLFIYSLTYFYWFGHLKKNLRVFTMTSTQTVPPSVPFLIVLHLMTQNIFYYHRRLPDCSNIPVYSPVDWAFVVSAQFSHLW